MLLLTLSSIASGSNDFEQWTKLKIGVRLPPAVSPNTWYQDLDSLAQSTPDLEISATPLGFAIPAWKSEKNTVLVRAFLKGIRQNNGEPRFVYKTGTADVNIVTLDWKCPAIVYGPGDSTLDHTPDEHIDLEAYGHAVDVLTATLRTLTE